MNTFLKNSLIRHFDVRGVKMGQGQNVSFSFSNDRLGRNTEGRAGKHSAKERKRAGAIKERAATLYNISSAMAAQASASAMAWWWRVKS